MKVPRAGAQAQTRREWRQREVQCSNPSDSPCTAVYPRRVSASKPAKSPGARGCGERTARCGKRRGELRGRARLQRGRRGRPVLGARRRPQLARGGVARRARGVPGQRRAEHVEREQGRVALLRGAPHAVSGPPACISQCCNPLPSAGSSRNCVSLQQCASSKGNSTCVARRAWSAC
jgi:hypothetical protein